MLCDFYFDLVWLRRGEDQPGDRSSSGQGCSCQRRRDERPGQPPRGKQLIWPLNSWFDLKKQLTWPRRNSWFSNSTDFSLFFAIKWNKIAYFFFNKFLFLYVIIFHQGGYQAYQKDALINFKFSNFKVCYKMDQAVQAEILNIFKVQPISNIMFRFTITHINWIGPLINSLWNGEFSQTKKSNLKWKTKSYYMKFLTLKQGCIKLNIPPKLNIQP